MKSKRRPIWFIAAAAVMLLLGWALYISADVEQRELDDETRAAMAGKFVRLTDGYTHFELAGPNAARTVVLAAGFSVPYYIWDPTFNALTAAGFRVLRYDYFGRGYSDRPSIPFTDDMYVRQLDELLKALRIDSPIDLAGISFGGSLITSFADRYPDRVRSLIYFDPSIRKPYDLALVDHVPVVWNYLTTVLEQRYWAEGQLGDFLHPEKFPDWAKRYEDQMQYKGFRRARYSELVSNMRVDQTEQLKRVGQHPRPVLVFWGKQDSTVPFEESEWLMNMLPNGRLVAVDESGHLPQWEQPENVHPEFVEFLNQ
jgi:pimeloyl-ACP methyl ester carboxylesterase